MKELPGMRVLEVAGAVEVGEVVVGGTVVGGAVVGTEVGGEVGGGTGVVVVVAVPCKH